MTDDRGPSPSRGPSDVTVDVRVGASAEAREATTDPRLGRKMAVGAAWTILLRLADRGIGIISVAILARLLRPADFGVVALAVSVVAIIEVLGELNVEATLIRDPTAGRTPSATDRPVRLFV